MDVRLAQEADLEVIMMIIEHARAFLREQAIPQWQNQTGPKIATIKEDIALSQGYVLVDGTAVIGYAALLNQVEDAYTNIIRGAWDETYLEYVSIHRVAILPKRRGQGLSQFFLQKMIEIALAQNYHDIRIDTHPQNIIMQRVISKAGFNYIGHIELDQIDGQRLAFQLLK